MKIKYSRADADAQIIDIIKSGSRFNPTVQLGKLVGVSGTAIIAKTIIDSAASTAEDINLASLFAANQEAWQQDIDKLIALMNE